MEVTNKLTTDFMVMYIDVPIDKDTKHYAVNILCPDMDENIYDVSIYDLDGQDVYSRFEVNKFYEVLNGYELDELEYLILSFTSNRLELD